MSTRERHALAGRFEEEAAAATQLIAKLMAERAMLLSAAQELRQGRRRPPRPSH